MNLNPATSTSYNTATMNWFKFFQEERELWVQNVSATQLSMQFEVAPGSPAGVLIPIGSDPVCMTNEVPFEAIKKSLDFRKFLNRVPSVMQLLTTEQADEYFAAKARNLGAFLLDPTTGQQVPNIAAAREHAERERRNLTARPTSDDTVVAPNGQVHFSLPRSAQELQGLNAEQHMGVNAQAAAAAGLAHVPSPQATPSFNPQAAGFSNVGSAPVMMETLINPRVLYLCQQVSMQLAPNLRMPADQFFRELKQLTSALSLEDLQYIEAHGTYKTVKKWARDLQATRVAAGQGEGLEDGLDGSM